MTHIKVSPYDVHLLKEDDQVKWINENVILFLSFIAFDSWNSYWARKHVTYAINYAVENHPFDFIYNFCFEDWIQKSDIIKSFYNIKDDDKKSTIFELLYNLSMLDNDLLTLENAQIVAKNNPVFFIQNLSNVFKNQECIDIAIFNIGNQKNI